jgi:type IV pilus assembly protein PilB
MSGPRLDDARNRLGTLIDSGLLTAAQLDAALSEIERTGQPIGRVLTALGFVDEHDLPAVMACWLGCEAVDLAERTIDPEAARALSYEVSRRLTVVPVAIEGTRLVVAVPDPSNIILLDDLRLISGWDITPVVATREAITEALDRMRSIEDAAERVLQSEPAELPDADEELERAVDTAPVVRAVSGIIAQAVQQRASDIHIEPEERDLRVRYRVDGVLQEVARLPRTHQLGIISRLKVMADADIAERRLPQDGRASVLVDGKHIDLRIATLPTVWGEEVTIRILDRASSLLGLEDLGYSPEALTSYDSAIRRSCGAVLVTGPTGSGKSTTMYGTLSLLNERSKKIVTVEDPVEYRLEGLRQMQIHPHIGLTFPSALRSILRLDPDVIMVGEIRDRETAVTAIQAAMTGHLVLSTLHTNDAPSAITRLVDMGVEPFLVASAIECVMAQRLARRLCERCKEPTAPDRKACEELGLDIGREKRRFYRPVGCRRCDDSGFRGRIAIAEVMPLSEEIRRLAATKRPADEIRAVAVAEGMQTLLEDGFNKVCSGVTSLDEIVRILS